MNFSMYRQLKRLCLIALISLPLSQPMQAAGWHDWLSRDVISQQINSLSEREQAVLFLATITILWLGMRCLQAYLMSKPKVSSVSIVPQHLQCVAVLQNESAIEQYKAPALQGERCLAAQSSAQTGECIYSIHEFSENNRFFEQDEQDLVAMLSPCSKEFQYMQLFKFGRVINEYDRERLFEVASIPIECRFADVNEVGQSVRYLAKEKKLALARPNSLLHNDSDIKSVFEVFYVQADTYIMRDEFGKCIGFAITGIRKQFARDKRIRSCILYIHQPFRAKGHAKRLFNYMAHDLKQKGHENISFAIEKTDCARERWYDQLEGFTRTELSEWEYLYTQN